MKIQDIRKNLYDEDVAIAWVNLTAAGHEVSEEYISKISRGWRAVNSPLSKIIYKELKRLAKANIKALAEKKKLPLKSNKQAV